MKVSLIAVLCFTLLFACETKESATKTEPSKEWAIIIHGGAGNFYNGNIKEDVKADYDDSMQQALAIGTAILKEGGTSLEAVEQTIRFMEDDPIFNSGKGAVLTSEGTAELDASIMVGSDLDAGAVASIATTRHPISAAIAVMENSPHVMLSGQGADTFAKSQNLEQVDNSFFITEKRKRQYESAAKQREEKMGTVGCVAIDKNGTIVAGTSTGGTFYKRWGRIGDSPIIGAGTYASNESCGVSATGTGEYFIRSTVARDISALMEYKGLSMQDAMDQVIQTDLPAIDNENALGGVIGVDKDGNIAYSFNTYGMLHAFEDATGNQKLGLYQ